MTSDESVSCTCIDDLMYARRLPKRFAEMKQDVQRQMAESYKAMCSPNGAAHGSKEQCAPMQKQLTAALAA